MGEGRAASVEAIPEQVGLKKQITLFQGVAIIVGIIIGSGIFVSPVGILIHVKSVGMSLIMWGVCGLYNTLCALCYAELGASIPQSGGEYIYIKRAFGDFPAFVCLWINFTLICPVGVAALSLIASLYILQPIFPDCLVPAIAEKFIAVIIVCECCLCFINSSTSSCLGPCSWWCLLNWVMKWCTHGHGYKLYQCVGCCRDHIHFQEILNCVQQMQCLESNMHGTGCWCVYMCVTKHDTEHVKWKATSACHYVVISIVFVMCQTWVYSIFFNFFVTTQFWVLNPWPCSVMQNTVVTIDRYGLLLFILLLVLDY